MNECMKCGISLGSHQVHDSDICKRQQEINLRNKSGCMTACPWCGEVPADFNYSPTADHKQGCPRRGYR